ncbi:hypothetical protein TCE0_017r03212 [Talaromyces pinophilus]|uniref:FAD-binding domain-containing protein n=1 Tax=Talaromyces pinophilus TaxID=128442 RepID=A0A6V8H2R1_TALPI|nr:hypothetical protein TCE0_017r03212 [Talaromyces pinophilus]
MDPNTHKSPFKVIIIGSGLAGALLANGLIREGINVHVYERYERNSRRDGFQIRLTLPAILGLRSCLTPEHLAAVVKNFGPATGVKGEAPRVLHKDFSLLVDFSRFPAYGKNVPINRGILRNALSEPVYEAGKLDFEKSFESFEVIADGTEHEKIRVWFHDGSSDECDILIGADGSYSKVNKQVGLDSIHPIKKHIAFAAKCDLPTARFSKMSKELRVYLPGSRNQDDTQAGQEAAGKAYDESLSSIMVGLNVAKEIVPKGIQDADNDVQWDFVAECIRNWSSKHRETVELVRGAPLHIYTPRVATRPSRSWRKEVRSRTPGKPEYGHPRVWLMGDAVHAMLPPRGMGANQSMYDAVTMLPLLCKLDDVAKSRGNVSLSLIEEAVQEYEAEMIPRSFEWVKKSGGDDFVPVDSSTIKGKLFFILAAQALNLVCLWYRFKGIFTGEPLVEEIPEFSSS